MNHALAVTIIRFRAAQDRAVKIWTQDWGLRHPTSIHDWINVCQDAGLYQTRRYKGIPIYVHGFGVELILPDVRIDFDWGPNGEPNGFDAWRLWIFILNNKLDVPFTDSLDLDVWLCKALKNGELIQPDMYGLLYLAAEHPR